ncbi:EAL domain-containing protein [Thalassospiraceae bacterium LMO-SO8]|nr:EAL domain-containing protein [Alphaproteobacteria bacterium LMO-S08]WND75622.1 EAL domain-containing protein [Thalassospiraceae bacterium LMO-SO8]
MTKETEPEFRQLGCKQCLESNPLDFEITMAFQPIVDLTLGVPFAYEALVRGKGGEGAGQVLSKVTEANRYAFDQTCRVKAVQLASQLNLDCKLSINFMPNAVYRPETCIRATMEAADEFNFPIDQIIFEVTEAEPIKDPAHLLGIFNAYQERGFITAIDDFGAGYAGLNLLTKFKPQVLKLDMELCQGIADDVVKRTITEGAIRTAKALDILVIAEGVETTEDLRVLRDLGADYFQGYLLARPQIEALPLPDLSKI